MPLATRAIEAGIPPRVHEPKKKRRAAKLTMKKTQKGSKKRARVDTSESESDSDSSNSESSQEATPKLKSRKKAKKGKKAKRRRVEAESESEGDVEVIADVEPLAKEPEVVEDTSDDQGQVSMTRLSRMIKTHPKILGWPQRPSKRWRY
jgi:hypothetical protein